MLENDVQEFLAEMAGVVPYEKRRFKGGDARREEALRLLNHRATLGTAVGPSEGLLEGPQGVK